MDPDLIPAFLIKDCAVVFTKMLLFIFNLMLRSASFPQKWKISRVCPVYKKGESSEIINYRPITIICNFGKIFEIILHSTIYSHVSDAISSDQHGVMKGRSTVSNLVCKAQFLCESLDRGNQVDVIYTDFSKAFNRLDHSTLISKLDNFSFSYPLLRLIQSYLLNRHQFVQYRGYKCASFWQKSGVPQESILGTLYFVKFIDGIL